MKWNLQEKGNGIAYKYKSTQVDLQPYMTTDVFRQVQSLIPPDCIYRELPQVPAKDVYNAGAVADAGDEEYGLEDNPHITVLYGLHNESDMHKIAAELKDWGVLRITIGEVTAFRRPESAYDVLKMNCISPDLHVLHNHLKATYDNSFSYPEYCPHLTLAYIKKGGCTELEGASIWTGMTYVVNTIIFSRYAGAKVVIKLVGAQA